jgi:DNA-binding transcriptional MerR regulator
MIIIGELSRRTGVVIETIRYYERTGLLPSPQRSESGRRLYDDKAVRRLTLVRQSRDLGLGVREISELLALSDEPNASCMAAVEIARRQVAAIDVKIKRLRNMRRGLATVVEECSGTSVDDCRIIAALTHSKPGQLSTKLRSDH